MIYTKVAALGILAFLIFVLSFSIKSRFSWMILMLSFICTGFLSFYVFYYIGSYSSSNEEAYLYYELKKLSEGCYNLYINVEWNKKPEIFGFNGGDDGLIVRYNPARVKITSSDKSYDSGLPGKCLLPLPEDFKYSAIGKGEEEIKFKVRDGEDYGVRLYLIDVKPEARISVYFIHDYKLPIETSTYWEKGQTVIIDK